MPEGDDRSFTTYFRHVRHRPGATLSLAAVVCFIAAAATNGHWVLPLLLALAVLPLSAAGGYLLWRRSG